MFCSTGHILGPSSKADPVMLPYCCILLLSSHGMQLIPSLISRCWPDLAAVQVISRAGVFSHVLLALQDLQTLILINCGATEDVAKLLDLQENVRVIVIDSHRPFHHNLNDPDNKIILAFCNPADGTCDNVPEPDYFSGTIGFQIRNTMPRLRLAYDA